MKKPSLFLDISNQDPIAFVNFFFLEEKELLGKLNAIKDKLITDLLWKTMHN